MASGEVVARAAGTNTAGGRARVDLCTLGSGDGHHALVRPQTACSEAAAKGDVAALRSLASKNRASLHERNALQQTALHVAVEHNQLHACAVLLELGIDVNAVDAGGNMALHVAAFGGNTAIVDTLLIAKASADMRSTSGWTPLHMAAENGRISVCTTLLRMRGVDVNAKGPNGIQAMHLACGNGHTDVCQVLFAAPRLSVTPDDDGQSPLHHAAIGGHSAVCTLLLAHGSDAAQVKRHGWTAAHVAAGFGHVAVLQALRSVKADVLGAAAPRSKWTPLHVAAAKNQSAVVAYLLAQGVDAAPQASRGETPAHVAAWLDHLESMQALLDARSIVAARGGGDPLLVPEAAGRVPFAVAPPWGRVIDLLKSAGYGFPDKSSGSDDAHPFTGVTETTSTDHSRAASTITVPAAAPATTYPQHWQPSMEPVSAVAPDPAHTPRGATLAQQAHSVAPAVASTAAAAAAMSVQSAASPVVDDFTAFHAYKRDHPDRIIDGKFYIVYAGRVLDHGFDTREDARNQLCAAQEAGADVDLCAGTVLEAGNEYGRKTPTQSVSRIMAMSTWGPLTGTARR